MWDATLMVAYLMGKKQAEEEQSYGQEVPWGAPLSGEWAGAPTPGTIVEALGLDWYEVDGESIHEIAEWWEKGYFEAWPEKRED